MVKICLTERSFALKGLLTRYSFSAEKANNVNVLVVGERTVREEAILQGKLDGQMSATE